MEERPLKRYVPTAFLLVLCVIAPYSAYSTIGNWQDKFLFHFSHANIFHLVTNFAVMARFLPRWRTVLLAYLVATASAHVPFSGMYEPTCGISAMVFAMLARRDAIFKQFNWKMMVANQMLMIIPSINWKIHAISYVISFLLWTIITDFSQTQTGLLSRLKNVLKRQ